MNLTHPPRATNLPGRRRVKGQHAETADRLRSVIASEACVRACIWLSLLRRLSSPVLCLHAIIFTELCFCMSLIDQSFCHQLPLSQIAPTKLYSRRPWMTLPKDDQQSQSIPREPASVGRKPSMRAPTHTPIPSLLSTSTRNPVVLSPPPRSWACSTDCYW